jgi:hypothetical protein
MRQMIGTFILGVASLLASIFAVALHWPWTWWVWVLLGVLCMISGILIIWRDGNSSELPSAGAGKEAVTASGDRSVVLNTNYGIVSTGDDTTIDRQ